METPGSASPSLPLSGDLHYLTGHGRRLPTYGDIGYARDWVAGAYFRPVANPTLVLPRMIVEFEGIPGELVVSRDR